LFPHDFNRVARRFSLITGHAQNLQIAWPIRTTVRDGCYMINMMSFAGQAHAAIGALFSLLGEYVCDVRSSMSALRAVL